jgi:hypothetical protein
MKIKKLIDLSYLTINTDEWFVFMIKIYSEIPTDQTIYY